MTKAIPAAGLVITLQLFFPAKVATAHPGTGIAVDRQGRVRKVTADGRVTTLARGGRLLESTLAARLLGLGGRFGYMMGLAVDAGGNVFAANDGGRRVVRVSSSGQVTSVLERSGPWSPTGVALSGNDLYVLEWGTMPGPGLSVRVRRFPGERPPSSRSFAMEGRRSVRARRLPCPSFSPPS